MADDEQEQPAPMHPGGEAGGLPGGGFDFGGLLSQAMEMQDRLAGMQEAAADTVIEGRAGGGAVRIEVSGDLNFQSVTIDPAAVDPDDVSLLEDMVLAALRDAMDQIAELSRSTMEDAGLGSLSALGEMMGLGDLGGLGGLGGGSMPGLGSLSQLGLGGLGVHDDEDGDEEDGEPGDDEEEDTAAGRPGGEGSAG